MGGNSYYILYPEGRFTLRFVIGFGAYAGVYEATGRRLTLVFGNDSWQASADLLGPSFIIHPGAQMRQFDFTDETYTYLGRRLP